LRISSLPEPRAFYTLGPANAASGLTKIPFAGAIGRLETAIHPIKSPPCFAGTRHPWEVILKTIWTIAVPVVAALALGTVQTQAATSNPNLAGTFKCGPDTKVCQWSGQTFTITQAGNHLDIKNDKGETGTATLTSPISVSAGPPWNMLGVISADGKTIDWSNGSQWKKT
jgi:hypothetical protein